MPAPSDSTRSAYMFSDDIKFFQKAVVLHPTEDKLLALKRSPNDKARPNKWDLIGGNVHFGEKHDESLKREIQEETHLEVDGLTPIQVVTNFENGIYYLFIGYKAKALGDKVWLSKEHTEYRWVSKEEFFTLDCGGDFLYKLVKEL